MKILKLFNSGRQGHLLFIMTAPSQKASHAVSLGLLVLGLMPWSLYGFDTCPSKHWRWGSPNIDADISMTTLLSNTFAHFTGPSFNVKTNNQSF